MKAIIFSVFIVVFFASQVQASPAPVKANTGESLLQALHSTVKPVENNIAREAISTEGKKPIVIIMGETSETYFLFFNQLIGFHATTEASSSLLTPALQGIK